MGENQGWCAAAVIKDSVFLFRVNGEDEITTTVETYSLTTDTWFTADTNRCSGRGRYLVCALMDKVYIIGGRKDSDRGKLNSSYNSIQMVPNGKKLAK